MTATINTQRAGRISTRKTIIGTGIGNAVEWYDWAMYATFTPFIAGQLFSKSTPPQPCCPRWRSSRSASWPVLWRLPVRLDR